ncbi:hypothetical protein QBC34DRAFT_410875 [Podospora aff. communis PSN243]|uniref:SSCRP protein n=1 Tax=Podospora aff. communis PSN243 TaxID=3040156 RepID=A0AAV9GFA9_9PEZI|nr:hypothetical protein QBC34DRAFT_410875 [Podospora aff. communis PSN243]
MLLLPLLLLPLTFALPTEGPPARPPAQQVHLIFHAAPVQYEMTVPADGKFHATPNNGLNVNLIDAPDFNIEQCEFHTVKGSPATYVWQTTASPTVGTWRISQYAVGPPQIITGVTCKGTCLGVYSTCYENGQFLGGCCNGYCAANKCRPYTF